MSQHAAPPTGGTGIAISGGGIRAACLGLGALQAADESGTLARARYVSAVSGGSYTATAFLASRATVDDSEPGARLPWARASLEEQHLRQQLRYLGEDWSDVLVGAVQYAIGLVLNLLPFLAASYLLFASLGELYTWSGSLECVDGELVASQFPLRLGLAAGFATVAAFVDRKISWDRISRGVRFLSMTCVVGILLPDLLVLTSTLLDRPAAVLARFLLILLALPILGTVVLRSQWIMQTSPVRLIGVRLLRGLFSLLTLTLLLSVAALALKWSLQMTPTERWTLIGVSIILLLVFGSFVHANATSLHTLYMRRLDRAFVVRAETDDEPVTLLSATRFTDVRGERMPELLVCAAVNLADNESAEGEGCGSFLFSAEKIGGPRVGPADMEHYARAVWDERLNCASVIAASGAAIAPNMGMSTKRSLRAIMSLANLRLGLWLPNPDRDYPSDARVGRLRRGWLEPGPLSTWREAMGRLSRRHRFVFVSDGGHWDNSGVVELLRQRCRYIFAVDASIDQHRMANLLRLITLARVEVNVEFEADGALLTSTDPVVKIPFSYAGDEDGLRGYLLVMRTHISPKMPPDLVAMGESSTPFPRHSTLNQFFRARDVDAYVALGRWLFAESVRIADLPPGPVEPARG